MTRHFYRTSLEGSRVVVTIGYDDRLFYMYIERLRPDRGEDDFIYHSGFAGSPKGFDDIKGVLASFGMKLPEEMAKEIRGTLQRVPIVNAFYTATRMESMNAERLTELCTFMSAQNDYFAVKEVALMLFENFKTMIAGLDVPEGAELLHVGMSREGAVTLNWKKGPAFGRMNLSVAGGDGSGSATATGVTEGAETASGEEKYVGVFRYLDCSTGHVTKADMDIFDVGSPESVIAYANEYGAFVHVPYDCPEGSPDPFVEMLQEGFSESFVKVLRYAKECQCFWVKFDADGILHENLDHHTW